mmetsp:Transcript_38686/g.98931  ORF Transcript_38686/g.98931 Transcript_38686/m.98931 type:complete len:333 (-) Transcript_38686:12-1010(-)
MTSSPAVFLVLLLFWLLVADGELQGQLRIAVCLLGQVGRTEMESKVNNLVRPNLADNVTLDLYLVLQPGARFSNNPSPDCKIAPKSVQAVVDRFAKLLPTFAIDNPRLDLEVNADTWVDYHEKGSDLEKRLSNHVNQYHAWHRCARAIENHEIAAGVTYDAVLRLRDNALVLKPFLLRACLREHARNWYNTRQEEPPHPITNAHLRGLPVIVKKCCSWGGYHDKAMLVPRIHMDSALSGPADEFHLIQKKEERLGIRNSETYLKFVMDKYHVPVYQQGRASDFPITDGRCEDGKSFCVVESKKDCRPRDMDDVKQCQQSYNRKSAPRPWLTV